MIPILQFLIRRFFSILVSLLVITALLYAFMMLTPAEERASLFLPSSADRMKPEQLQIVINQTIKSHHLNDPFFVQYGFWLLSLVQGKWGWSPSLQGNVLTALLHRTPVTIELTIYSLLVFIPLGMVSGVKAGWKKKGRFDTRFRLMAFIASSLPSFILAIILMAIFYVWLRWFPPGRLGVATSTVVNSAEFVPYTSLLTIDGFLNGRPDITLDAFRHLVLPVISLGFLHWATLGRVVRIATLDERHKDYITAGRARGLSDDQLQWKHVFRNVLAPALTSSALSAASLFTGVIVIERVFNLKGISDLIISIQNVPDAPAVMGFAVYSVSVVLLLMLVLDFIQAVADPRYRMGGKSG